MTSPGGASRHGSATTRAAGSIGVAAAGAASWPHRLETRIERAARSTFLLAKRFGPMPSTVIRRFEYRSESRELEVLFVTGRRYLYIEVPAEEADAFRAAFSKGAFFNRRIRDRYRHTELVD